MSILFVRRRNLGRGSTRGMAQWLRSQGIPVKIWRNDRRMPDVNPSLIVRWGCTSTVSMRDGQKVLNAANGIHAVNNKAGFRRKLIIDQPEIVPRSVVHIEGNTYNNMDPQGSLQEPVILRPGTHSRGRNLDVVQRGSAAILAASMGYTDWYASVLHQKVAEYRVYVYDGRVVSVAEKTPDNPDAVAWNVAQGGEFSVVRWGAWPLDVCRVAIEGMKHSNLTFGGVDVMVTEERGPLLIEINSAPSLPALSDGSISYRQTCMAKAIKWSYEQKDVPSVENYGNWRDVIHPAISGETV